MELIKNFVEFILHLDIHLGTIIQTYGLLTYGLLFFVIFMETGLVIMPFLPGDSLLFAAGAFAAVGSLDIYWLFGLLAAAAIIGDTVNYWAGHFAGPKVFRQENIRFLNKKHLESAQRFYEKHGGKTIIIARFVPIIRTFAPFIAGIGQMNYGRFISYNIIGGISWVAIFIFGGYFFGNIPIVKNNFSLAIIAIILISLLPALFELLRHRR